MKIIKIKDLHDGVYYVNPSRIECFYISSYEIYGRGKREDCTVIELTNGRKIESKISCEELLLLIKG